MKKNFWTKMISLALALVCVLSLVACGGGGGNSDAAGNYSLDSVKTGDSTMSWKDVAAAAGMSTDDVAIGLELKSDGTFKLNMDAMDPTLTGEGKWSADGNTITLSGDGDSLTATLNGSEITIEQDGVTLIFKK